MKTCTKCKQVKNLDLYPKDRRNISGYCSWCKECKSKQSCKRSSIRRATNSEFREAENKRNREQSSNLEFKARKNYKSKVRNKQRYAEDPVFRKKQRELAKTYTKNRLINDPIFRLKLAISTLIRKSLRRRGYSKRNKTEIILGASHDFFFNYINQLAISKYDIPYDSSKMDIDHINPLHNASSEEDVVRFNHFTNLQPLSHEDHLVKTNADMELFRRQK